MTPDYMVLMPKGYKYPTMVLTKERDSERRIKNKQYHSTDYRLQLVCMKSDLVVIVDKNATVNFNPHFVQIARQLLRLQIASELVSLIHLIFIYLRGGR